MFKNEFQGGPYFEVFSAQAKDAIADWKQSGSGAKKEFDKEVRSFVYVIEGSTATTKIQIPKDSKQSLTLIQRFLILQLCVPRGHDFSIDLSVSDHGNQKRRLVLSTAYKETKINPLHSKIPLGFIKRSKWLNLCLDMLDLVNGTWHGQTYKCIDCISIAGNCKLRRIFTMKLQPLDTTDDEELYGFPSINNGVQCDGIPKQCQLAIDIPQDIQVVTLTKVRHFEKRGHPGEALTSRTGSQQDLDLSSSGGRKTVSQDSYHIAFGTKISGSGQPRKGSGKDRNSSSQHSKSHPSQMKSDASAESLHTSRASAEKTENKDGTQFAKPHPPREPSSDKRRRPRVKSAGHDHTSSQLSKADESSSAYSSMNSSRGASQSRSNSGNKSRRGERAQTCLQQPKVVASEEEVEQIIQEMALSQQHDCRKSETESDGSHNTSEIQDPDTVNPDLMMDVIKALNEQVLRNEEAQEYEESEMETKDMNDEDTEALYTFASRPKGVPDKPKSGGSKFERNPVQPRKRRSHSDLPCYENASSLTASSDENETEASHVPTRNAGGHLKANKSKPQADNNAKLYTGHSKNLMVPQTVNSSTCKSNGLLQVAPQITKSPHQSQTRYSVSRRSLREITNEDWKQSQPYNANKYQPNKVAEVTDSYEKQMLASLQRQMMESGSSSDGEKATRLHHYNNEAMVGSSDEDDDTDRSTLKLTSQHNAHNYQDEMKILSQEFLSQSNPRDWGNVFSPPIAMSSTKNNKQSDDDTSSNNEFKTKEGESDGDEMLDLLYDPVLNCYYDPVSCKYYELV